MKRKTVKIAVEEIRELIKFLEKVTGGLDRDDWQESSVLEIEIEGWVERLREILE